MLMEFGENRLEICMIEISGNNKQSVGTKSYTETEAGDPTTPDPVTELVSSLHAALQSSLTPSTPSASSCPMVVPAAYSGELSECQGFLMQCQLYFEVLPHQFSGDQAKIAFIISLLSGKACRWAESMWTMESPVMQSLDPFLVHFKDVFGTSTSALPVHDELFSLQQANRAIHDYTLHFCTLAASSGWNEGHLLPPHPPAALQHQNLCRRTSTTYWLVNANVVYTKGYACTVEKMTTSSKPAQPVLHAQRKVEAIKSWPKPGTVKDLQHFHGFVNFYRRFISGYSDLTAPLTSLLCKKPKNLSWTSGTIEAFWKLKAAICMAPTLVHADPTWPFIVEVDTSVLGMGAVLSQRRGETPALHPYAYFSKKLSPAEQNYDIRNRELLAIKLALEEHWMEGPNHPFEVITDHKHLQYLREAKRLNPRQAQWAPFCTRFNFCVTYPPGNKNTKVDALSRIHSPDPMAE
ncbi:hypothetical protein QTP86_002918 [Hemibagrus guttatus]|nr:hypothetical protein QTP86_002918 [Hemibagrus guttatus]